METPIFDFVKRYADSNPVRAHMPGHKGRGIILKEKAAEFSGIYKYDITEVDGADYLSAPCGIIAESERNAGQLFGCDTFYSTEGSSLCIRAMLYLVKKSAEQAVRKPHILAGRNAHASFVNACAILDIDVDWIMPLETESYESCSVDGEYIEGYIADILQKNVDNTKNDNQRSIVSRSIPDALYVTSPDYLGNMLNIEELAEVCHEHGMLLLVDNAHGAYLKFLKKSAFPIDLGADICCSSAHKTLPVLTGGAYLHISKSTDSFFAENARQALSIFASSSPSYLILQSLDLCNEFLANKALKEKLYRETAKRVNRLKKQLEETGYSLEGTEPLKITINLTNIGIDGNTVSETLKDDNIIAEYHDETHIVMMFSPANTDDDFLKVETVLTRIHEATNGAYPMDSYKNSKSACSESDFPYIEFPIQNSNKANTKRIPQPIRSMSFKETMMARAEYVDVKDSIGRIMAHPVLSCPPCVPLYVYGEVIGEDILNYYSGKITVVSQNAMP